MSTDAYEMLADALDALPNGFPRTPSNVEIAMLRRIASPEEASVACHLGGKMEPVEVIAGRLGISTSEAEERLTSMARRGLLWSDTVAGKPHFRLAPFIVGIYEAQLGDMDHELAHLFEKYMADGGAAGLMGPSPALHRVVPAQRAVKSEWVLPYDDVKKILEASATFSLQDCVCRVEQDYIGRRCSFPLRTCLSFSSTERPPAPLDVSKEEALAFLDNAEELGLVHTVSNVVEGVGYVCNCCGCCCGILRGINDWGIESSVAKASYFAVIDPDECSGCEQCVARCQVHAISMKDGETAAVDRRRCIGCGACATGCPTGAAHLERRPDAEVVRPPLDFGAWEQERLRDRGMQR